MFIVLLYNFIFGELSLLEFRLMVSRISMYFFGLDWIGFKLWCSNQIGPYIYASDRIWANWIERAQSDLMHTSSGKL